MEALEAFRGCLEAYEAFNLSTLIYTTFYLFYTIIYLFYTIIYGKLKPKKHHILYIRTQIVSYIEQLSNNIKMTHTTFTHHNAEGGHDENKILNSDKVALMLSMSCETFWKYEITINVDRRQFSKRYINCSEEEALQRLSQFLCLQMKKHIEDQLINEGRREMLSKLEQVFPKFHIHGQTSHEILYPNDPSNSAHCRGDGKIFICTHC